MNRTELYNHVHDDHPDLKKTEVKQIVDDVMDYIIAGVVEQGEFKWPGFGKIVVKERKARMGRNPRTGEAIKIPKKKVLKFSPAKAFKDAAMRGSL